MWSEVLALDMLSPFGDNIMNPRVGRRFREIVLANGGQVPPMKLVEEFLGRKPSPEAFFREITGQRGRSLPAREQKE
jgi:thimet oligopeptidase